jgi:phage gp29-like protein
MIRAAILSSPRAWGCFYLFPGRISGGLVDWTVELNFGTQAVSPRIQFDLKEHASWQQLVEAVDRNIPVSKSAIYERYGIPEPANAEDEFIKPSINPLSAIELADTGKKKAHFPLL